jgi:hypothetical protein
MAEREELVRLRYFEEAQKAWVGVHETGSNPLTCLPTQLNSHIGEQRSR